MPPSIELVRATPEQQPIVANFMELYAHDFSEFFPSNLDPTADSATRIWPSIGLSPTERHSWFV